MAKIRGWDPKKKQAAYITVATAFAAIAVITGLGLVGFEMDISRNGSEPPVLLESTFETFDSKCQSGDLGDMEVRRVSTTVTVEVPIQTPTPCYNARGTAVLRGDEITIDIETDSRTGICIQCVGSITARVTIRNLPTGQYDIVVNTPDGTSTTRI